MVTLGLILALHVSSPCHANLPPVDPELRDALRTAILESDSFADRLDAEGWIKDMSRRIQRWLPDPIERAMVLRLVHREATRVGVEPELVLAVIHVESLYQREAVSSAGALGLMQVMPFWKNEIGRPGDDLFAIDTNLRYGCTILKHYLDREGGDIVRALGRYNGSLGQLWYPERVVDAWDRYYFVLPQ